MTARDLIASSLRLLGVLASGETPSAQESTDGLAALNDMIDSWSTESLMIPAKIREVFSLTPSKQSYSIGIGGDFDTSRPVRIENALIQLDSVSPAIEIPMKLLNKDQFASIILKQMGSTYPLYLYGENTFPLETVNVSPVPTTNIKMALYTWKPLSQVTDLNADIVMPPGFSRAMRYNLALDLAPEYGRAIPEVVAAIAAETKANVKRINSRPQYLQVDDSLRAKPAVWNWMTGEPS